MKNFLEDIKNKIKKGKTISVLAPMADVTDMVFRKIIAKYSKPFGPDIFWTEFVSADGLSSPGQEALKIDLLFSKNLEKPILGQIFGSQIENIRQAVKIVYDLGFDGVDINMGCPDKNIEKQGAGAKTITTPELAKEIILAMQKEREILNKNKKRFFSVSVKTRIGFNKIEYKTWFPFLLDRELDILTIHLRTRKELSLVSAHWELAEEILIFIKNYCEKNNLKIPLIILNGDVKNILEAEKKIQDLNLIIQKNDLFVGVMIGRGVFGTPWLFNKKEFIKRNFLDIKNKKGKENIKFRLKILLEHIKDFEKKLGKYKSFHIMKKHFKGYIKDFENAGDLRNNLMNCKDYKEIKKVIDLFLKEKLK